MKPIGANEKSYKEEKVELVFLCEWLVIDYFLLFLAEVIRREIRLIGFMSWLVVIKAVPNYF